MYSDDESFSFKREQIVAVSPQEVEVIEIDAELMESRGHDHN
jgi:hypothetical protein